MTHTLRLFLVRHGNTFNAGDTITQVGRKTDLPLTEKGREQAQSLAHFFQAHQITPTKIYAGQLSRQQETARLIGAPFDITQIQTNPCLTEIDYGPWEGLTTEAIQQSWPKEYEDWNMAAAWPEELFSETLSDRLDNIHRWVNNLYQQANNDDVFVAVSSNGILRFFYSLLKEEWHSLVQERRIQTLKVGTGCFCELAITERHVTVIQWNQKPE